MSTDSDPEFDDADAGVRPIVLPLFKIPARLVSVVGWGLVISALLAIVAALVSAVSYRRAIPHVTGLGPGIHVFQPSLGFGDRVALFASGSGDLSVALLVVLAAVMVAMAAREDGSSPLPHWSALLVGTCVVGSVVVLADLAEAGVILSNGSGQFTAQQSANKAASLLALLAPVLSAAAAVTYAATRIRTAPEHPTGAGGQ